MDLARTLIESLDRMRHRRAHDPRFGRRDVARLRIATTQWLGALNGYFEATLPHRFVLRFRIRIDARL